MRDVSAIIAAAGEGSRLGLKTPKAFIPLGGRPLFLHSLEAIAAHPAIDGIVVVVPPDMIPAALQAVASSACDKKTAVIPGGSERWLSVENGVRACDAAWVLVHDAARPFVTAAVIDAVLEKRRDFDCVITATPEVDTIRMRDGALAGGLVDRSKLVRIGTPQLFKREILLKAFATAPSLSPPPTDEAALVQACGVPVALAEGDPLNFKITVPSDLALAEAYCAGRP